MAGTVRPFRKHEVPKTKATVGGRINQTIGFVGEG
jgi:hypothetical protein